mmetsp:Transcript_43571/g.78682  ORF Transcript_43571/g.78682 Transcript_43571/m.78682 type:complete len:81 (-) Transcript_43571:25-267(-)
MRHQSHSSAAKDESRTSRQLAPENIPEIQQSSFPNTPKGRAVRLSACAAAIAESCGARVMKVSEAYQGMPLLQKLILSAS